MINPQKKHGFQYISSLDGVRAIAIISVLIYHVSPGMLSGGFTGVDVFFVLSGFLITSIVQHDVREDVFSFKEFYVRRIQRLMPNAIACILAVLLLSLVFMPPSTEVQLGFHGLWTLFNLSNIYTWRKMGGYWGEGAGDAPLTHFWSLAIEEQFYLVFPILLFCLLRFQSKRVRWWLAILGAISFGMCMYGTYSMSMPTATFYLFPTRVWELLLGAALAARGNRLHSDQAQTRFSCGPKLREILGWCGLGTIVAGFVFINDYSSFPGLTALVPTAGTLLVLMSANIAESKISRFLSMPAMVSIGRLSYSLYLWHWPLIVFGSLQFELLGKSKVMGAAWGAFVSIPVAWCAHRYIEQPLRKRGEGRAWRLKVVAASFVVAVICCIFASQGPRKIDPGNLDRKSVV